MNKILIEKPITKIVEALIAAKDAYYNGEPIISDEEFDSLEDSLREVDPENSYFEVVGALSNKVKVKHEVPMLSLEKTKTIEGVFQWIQKMDLTGELLVLEPKIDGLSCSILYEDGRLTRITTRGDGFVGQDITHIAKFVKTVPQRISLKGRKEVRGELYLPKNTKFPNPDEKPLRNLVVGLINRKDSGLEDLGFVKFVAYQLVNSIRYEEERLDLLHENKFNTIQRLVTDKEKEIEEYCNKYLEKLRNEWEYTTDGLVLVVNDSQKWEELDSKYIVHHHHFYNLALKPPSQSKETILENIEWNVSRLGRVIPTAVVKSIIIGGSTITRCSLNNVEFVEKLGLRIGDRVVIERANDVIPHFKENLSYMGAYDQRLTPKRCPSCDGKLEREGVHLVCFSKNCSERLIEQILYWVKKCEMDGLSGSFVKKLVESERIKSIKDLYQLVAKDFVGIEGFGSKKIENALTQINLSKEMSIRQFVVRLGINGVGERALKKLGINNVKELWSFRSNSSVVGNTLSEFVQDNKKFIKDLLSVVKVYSEIPKKKGKLNICMTGTGPRGRKELISEIEKMGCSFMDHVCKDTNILVCEDVHGSSSKLVKAAKLGVKLVGYQEFFSTLGD